MSAKAGRSERAMSAETERPLLSVCRSLALQREIDERPVIHVTSSDAGSTSVRMRKPQVNDSRIRQVVEAKQERVNVQAERVQRLRASRMREADAEEVILHSVDDMLRRIRECAQDDWREETT
jgi:hypothetical protein